jgi:PAS domain-containing protein
MVILHPYNSSNTSALTPSGTELLHISDLLILQCVCKKWRHVMQSLLSDLSIVILSSRTQYYNQHQPHHSSHKHGKVYNDPIVSINWERNNDDHEVGHQHSHHHHDHHHSDHITYVDAATASRVIAQCHSIEGIIFQRVHLSALLIQMLRNFPVYFLSLDQVKVYAKSQFLGAAAGDADGGGLEVSTPPGGAISTPISHLQQSHHQPQQQMPNRGTAVRRVTARSLQLPPAASLLASSSQQSSASAFKARKFTGADLMSVLRNCGRHVRTLLVDIHIGQDTVPANMFEMLPNLHSFGSLNMPLAKDHEVVMAVSPSAHFAGPIHDVDAYTESIYDEDEAGKRIGMKLWQLLLFVGDMGQCSSSWNSQAEAMIITNSVGNIVVANAAFERLSGRSARNLMGLHWSCVRCQHTDTDGMLVFEDTMRKRLQTPPWNADHVHDLPPCQFTSYFAFGDNRSQFHVPAGSTNKSRTHSIATQQREQMVFLAQVCLFPFIVSDTTGVAIEKLSYDALTIDKSFAMLMGLLHVREGEEYEFELEEENEDDDDEDGDNAYSGLQSDAHKARMRDFVGTTNRRPTNKPTSANPSPRTSSRRQSHRNSAFGSTIRHDTDAGASGVPEKQLREHFHLIRFGPVTEPFVMK